MPHITGPSRIEHLLSETLAINAKVLEVTQAGVLSEQSVIGEPESATIAGTAETIIPANGGRLLGIGNLSPQPAFLAISKTAIAGAGLPLQGNTTQFFPIREGSFVSAVTMGGNVELSWQLFG